MVVEKELKKRKVEQELKATVQRQRVRLENEVKEQKKNSPNFEASFTYEHDGQAMVTSFTVGKRTSGINIDWKVYKDRLEEGEVFMPGVFNIYPDGSVYQWSRRYADDITYLRSDELETFVEQLTEMTDKFCEEIE